MSFWQARVVRRQADRVDNAISPHLFIESQGRSACAGGHGGVGAQEESETFAGQELVPVGDDGGVDVEHQVDEEDVAPRKLLVTSSATDAV